MKLTTFILIAALTQVSAKGYGQKISLDEKNTPLETVLRSIGKQSGYNFIYNSEEIKGLRTSVKLKNLPVMEAIQETIKNLPISFKLIKNHIVLTIIAPVLQRSEEQRLFKDSVLVRGRVTDSTGHVISGARVFVVKMDSKAGSSAHTTMTLTDGTFNVITNVGDLITVSYVGYKDALIVTKQEMPFQQVVLKVETVELKEVTIQTGYQKLSKERATGSYSKPDMKVLARRTGTLDLISRLDGQIPGLTVTPNHFDMSANGEGPATQKGRALVRGSSSVVLPTAPLYVMNGIIVTDFRSLNLDDIEDVTVLKDAAAAAIWGAQAANGVIVITTKSGKKDQKLQISYSGSVDFHGKPDLDYQRYLGTKDYITVAKQLFDPINFPYSSLSDSFISPLEEILYSQYAKYDRKDVFDQQALASLDSLSSLSNRKQIKDLFYRNAISNNHTLSASGGNSTYNFYSSFGYTNSANNTPGNAYNSYRLNLSQSLSLGKRISLSLNTNLSQSVSKDIGSSSIGNNASLPYQLFKDGNGNNVNMPYIISDLSKEKRNLYQSLSGIDLNTYSPIDDRNTEFSNTKLFTANLTADATVKLWKGLRFIGTYGYLTSPGTSINYQDHTSYDMRMDLLNLTIPGEGNSDPTYLIPNYGGKYDTKNMNQRSWTIRNQLAYDFTSPDGNSYISLQAGQEARESLITSNSSSLLGYDLNLQTYAILDYNKLRDGYPNTVTGFGSWSEKPFDISESLSRFTSYYALGSYSFQQKYSIDGSWRVDHSNLFGSDISAQNKPVWSAGARWNISKEDFMKPINWLNSLGLRATYGITGNSPYVGAATVNDILYQEQNTGYPLVGGPSYVISGPANKRLSWETTHTTNFGVDFSILKNKLSGSIEYYHKMTTNLLGNQRLNPIVGYASGLINIGKLRNEGLNITLSSSNVETKDFNWSTSFVFAYNKNKLLAYSSRFGEEDAAAKIYRSYAVGYPMSTMFAYRYAGLDDKGYPQVKLADGTITSDPRAVTEKDVVYMGTLIPVYNGGFSNTFRYRQFELALNMVYSLGAVMRRDLNNFWSGNLADKGFFSGNISPDFLNRWQKPGDEKTTNIPAYLTEEDYDERNMGYYSSADINVVSASYIKLRDIMFSYTLSPKILSQLKIQSLTIRAQMNNIMLWKANKFGIDPEYQDYSNGARDVRNEHTFNLALSVNF